MIRKTNGFVVFHDASRDGKIWEWTIILQQKIFIDL
jgi:hypothetical protein